MTVKTSQGQETQAHETVQKQGAQEGPVIEPSPDHTPAETRSTETNSDQDQDDQAHTPDVDRLDAAREIARKDSTPKANHNEHRLGERRSLAEGIEMKVTRNRHDVINNLLSSGTVSGTARDGSSRAAAEQQDLLENAENRSLTKKKKRGRKGRSQISESISQRLETLIGPEALETISEKIEEAVDDRSQGGHEVSQSELQSISRELYNVLQEAGGILALHAGNLASDEDINDAIQNFLLSYFSEELSEENAAQIARDAEDLLRVEHINNQASALADEALRDYSSLTDLRRFQAEAQERLIELFPELQEREDTLHDAMRIYAQRRDLEIDRTREQVLDEAKELATFQFHLMVQEDDQSEQAQGLLQAYNQARLEFQERNALMLSRHPDLAEDVQQEIERRVQELWREVRRDYDTVAATVEAIANREETLDIAHELRQVNANLRELVVQLYQEQHGEDLYEILRDAGHEAVVLMLEEDDQAGLLALGLEAALLGDSVDAEALAEFYRSNGEVLVQGAEHHFAQSHGDVHEMLEEKLSAEELDYVLALRARSPRLAEFLELRRDIESGEKEAASYIAFVSSLNLEERTALRANAQEVLGRDVFTPFHEHLGSINESLVEALYAGNEAQVEACRLRQHEETSFVLLSSASLLLGKTAEERTAILESYQSLYGEDYLARVEARVAQSEQPSEHEKRIFELLRSPDQVTAQDVQQELLVLAQEYAQEIAHDRGTEMGRLRGDAANLERLTHELEELRSVLSTLFPGRQEVSQALDIVIRQSEDQARFEKMSRQIYHYGTWVRSGGGMHNNHPRAEARARHYEEYLEAQRDFLEAHPELAKELHQHYQLGYQNENERYDQAWEIARNLHHSMAGAGTYDDEFWQNIRQSWGLGHDKALLIKIQMAFTEVSGGGDLKNWIEWDFSGGAEKKALEYMYGRHSQDAPPILELSGADYFQELNLEQLAAQSLAADEVTQAVLTAQQALMADEQVIAFHQALEESDAFLDEEFRERYEEILGISFEEDLQRRTVEDRHARPVDENEAILVGGTRETILSLLDNGRLTDEEMDDYLDQRSVELGRRRGQLRHRGAEETDPEIQELDQTFEILIDQFDDSYGRHALDRDRFTELRSLYEFRTRAMLASQLAADNAYQEGVARGRSTKSDRRDRDINRLEQEWEAFLDSNEDLFENDEFARHIGNIRIQSRDKGKDDYLAAHKAALELYRHGANRWGTEEAKFFAALEGLTPAQRRLLDEVYREVDEDHRRLTYRIGEEFSGWELDKAFALYREDELEVLAADFFQVVDWATTQSGLEGCLGRLHLITERRINDRLEQLRARGQDVSEEDEQLIREDITEQTNAEFEEIFLSRYQLDYGVESLQEAIEYESGGDNLRYNNALLNQSVDPDMASLVQVHRSYGFWNDDEKGLGNAVREQMQRELAEMGLEDARVLTSEEQEQLQVRMQAWVVRFDGIYGEGEFHELLNDQIGGPEKQWILSMLAGDILSADAHRFRFSVKGGGTHDDIYDEMTFSDEMRAELIDIERMADGELRDGKDREALRRELFEEHVAYLRTLQIKYDAIYWEGSFEKHLRGDVRGYRGDILIDRLMGDGEIDAAELVLLASGGHLDGTNTDVLKDIFHDIPLERIEEIRSDFSTREYGNLESVLRRELSGDDQFDVVTIGLRGRAETLDELRTQLLLRRGYEHSGWLSPDSQQRMDEEIDAVLAYIDDHADDPNCLRDAQILADRALQYAEVCRADRNRISDTVTEVVTVGVAVGVGILCALPTGGTSLVATALWIGSSAIIARTGTKWALKGGSYGIEELSGDVGMAAVDAVLVIPGAKIGALAVGRSASVLGRLTAQRTGQQIARTVAREGAEELGEEAAEQALKTAARESAEDAIEDVVEEGIETATEQGSQALAQRPTTAPRTGTRPMTAQERGEAMFERTLRGRMSRAAVDGAADGAASSVLMAGIETTVDPSAWSEGLGGFAEALITRSILYLPTGLIMGAGMGTGMQGFSALRRGGRGVATADAPAPHADSVTARSDATGTETVATPEPTPQERLIARAEEIVAGAQKKRDMLRSGVDEDMLPLREKARIQMREDVKLARHEIEADAQAAKRREELSGDATYGSRVEARARRVAYAERELQLARAKRFVHATQAVAEIFRARPRLAKRHWIQLRRNLSMGQLKGMVKKARRIHSRAVNEAAILSNMGLEPKVRESKYDGKPNRNNTGQEVEAKQKKADKNELYDMDAYEEHVRRVDARLVVRDVSHHRARLFRLQFPTVLKLRNRIRGAFQRLKGAQFEYRSKQQHEADLKKAAALDTERLQKSGKELADADFNARSAWNALVDFVRHPSYHRRMRGKFRTVLADHIDARRAVRDVRSRHQGALDQPKKVDSITAKKTDGSEKARTAVETLVDLRSTVKSKRRSIWAERIRRFTDATLFRRTHRAARRTQSEGHKQNIEELKKERGTAKAALPKAKRAVRIENQLRGTDRSDYIYDTAQILVNQRDSLGFWRRLSPFDGPQRVKFTEGAAVEPTSKPSKSTESTSTEPATQKMTPRQRIRDNRGILRRNRFDVRNKSKYDARVERAKDLPDGDVKDLELKAARAERLQRKAQFKVWEAVRNPFRALRHPIKTARAMAAATDFGRNARQAKRFVKSAEKGLEVAQKYKAKVDDVPAAHKAAENLAELKRDIGAQRWRVWRGRLSQVVDAVTLRSKKSKKRFAKTIESAKDTIKERKAEFPRAKTRYQIEVQLKGTARTIDLGLAASKVVSARAELGRIVSRVPLIRAITPSQREVLKNLRLHLAKLRGSRHRISLAREMRDGRAAAKEAIDAHSKNKSPEELKAERKAANNLVRAEQAKIQAKFDIRETVRRVPDSWYKPWQRIPWDGLWARVDAGRLIRDASRNFKGLLKSEEIAARVLSKLGDSEKAKSVAHSWGAAKHRIWANRFQIWRERGRIALDAVGFRWVTPGGRATISQRSTNIDQAKTSIRARKGQLQDLKRDYKVERQLNGLEETPALRQASEELVDSRIDLRQEPLSKWQQLRRQLKIRRSKAILGRARFEVKTKARQEARAEKLAGPDPTPKVEEAAKNVARFESRARETRRDKILLVWRSAKDLKAHRDRLLGVWGSAKDLVTHPIRTMRQGVPASDPSSFAAHWERLGHRSHRLSLEKSVARGRLKAEKAQVRREQRLARKLGISIEEGSGKGDRESIKDEVKDLKKTREKLERQLENARRQGKPEDLDVRERMESISEDIHAKEAELSVRSLAEIEKELRVKRRELRARQNETDLRTMRGQKARRRDVEGAQKLEGEIADLQKQKWTAKVGVAYQKSVRKTRAKTSGREEVSQAAEDLARKRQTLKEKKKAGNLTDEERTALKQQVKDAKSTLKREAKSQKFRSGLEERARAAGMVEEVPPAEAARSGDEGSSEDRNRILRPEEIDEEIAYRRENMDLWLTDLPTAKSDPAEFELVNQKLNKLRTEIEALEAKRRTLRSSEEGDSSSSGGGDTPSTDLGPNTTPSAASGSTRRVTRADEGGVALKAETQSKVIEEGEPLTGSIEDRVAATEERIDILKYKFRRTPTGSEKADLIARRIAKSEADLRQLKQEARSFERASTVRAATDVVPGKTRDDLIEANLLDSYRKQLAEAEASYADVMARLQKAKTETTQKALFRRSEKLYTRRGELQDIVEHCESIKVLSTQRAAIRDQIERARAAGKISQIEGLEFRLSQIDRRMSDNLAQISRIDAESETLKRGLNEVVQGREDYHALEQVKKKKNEFEGQRDSATDDSSSSGDSDEYAHLSDEMKADLERIRKLTEGDYDVDDLNGGDGGDFLSGGGNVPREPRGGGPSSGGGRSAVRERTINGPDRIRVRDDSVALMDGPAPDGPEAYGRMEPQDSVAVLDEVTVKDEVEVVPEEVLDTILAPEEVTVKPEVEPIVPGRKIETDVHRRVNETTPDHAIDRAMKGELDETPSPHYDEQLKPKLHPQEQPQPKPEYQPHHEPDTAVKEETVPRRPEESEPRKRRGWWWYGGDLSDTHRNEYNWNKKADLEEWKKILETYQVDSTYYQQGGRIVRVKRRGADGEEIEFLVNKEE